MLDGRLREDLDLHRLIGIQMGFGFCENDCNVDLPAFDPHALSNALRAAGFNCGNVEGCATLDATGTAESCRHRLPPPDDCIGSLTV